MIIFLILIKGELLERMVRLTRLLVSSSSLVLILLCAGAGKYTSKTFCGIKTGGLCAGLAPCTGPGWVKDVVVG